MTGTQDTRGGKSSELELQKSAALGRSYLRAAYLSLIMVLHIAQIFRYDISMGTDECYVCFPKIKVSAS